MVRPEQRQVQERIERVERQEKELSSRERQLRGREKELEKRDKRLRDVRGDFGERLRAKNLRREIEQRRKQIKEQRGRLKQGRKELTQQKKELKEAKRIAGLVEVAGVLVPPEKVEVFAAQVEQDIERGDAPEVAVLKSARGVGGVVPKGKKRGKFRERGGNEETGVVLTSQEREEVRKLVRFEKRQERAAQEQREAQQLESEARTFERILGKRGEEAAAEFLEGSEKLRGRLGLEEGTEVRLASEVRQKLQKQFESVAATSDVSESIQSALERLEGRTFAFVRPQEELPPGPPVDQQRREERKKEQDVMALAPPEDESVIFPLPEEERRVTDIETQDRRTIEEDFRVETGEQLSGAMQVPRFLQTEAEVGRFGPRAGLIPSDVAAPLIEEEIADIESQQRRVKEQTDVQDKEVQQFLEQSEKQEQQLRDLLETLEKPSAVGLRPTDEGLQIETQFGQELAEAEAKSTTQLLREASINSARFAAAGTEEILRGGTSIFTAPLQIFSAQDGEIPESPFAPAEDEPEPLDVFAEGIATRAELSERFAGGATALERAFVPSEALRGRIAQAGAFGVRGGAAAVSLQRALTGADPMTTLELGERAFQETTGIDLFENQQTLTQKIFADQEALEKSVAEFPESTARELIEKTFIELPGTVGVTGQFIREPAETAQLARQGFAQQIQMFREAPTEFIFEEVLPDLGLDAAFGVPIGTGVSAAISPQLQTQVQTEIQPNTPAANIEQLLSGVPRQEQTPLLESDVPTTEQLPFEQERRARSLREGIRQREEAEILDLRDLITEGEATIEGRLAGEEVRPELEGRELGPVVTDQRGLTLEEFEVLEKKLAREGRDIEAKIVEGQRVEELEITGPPEELPLRLLGLRKQRRFRVRPGAEETAADVSAFFGVGITPRLKLKTKPPIEQIERDFTFEPPRLTRPEEEIPTIERRETRRIEDVENRVESDIKNIQAQINDIAVGIGLSQVATSVPGIDVGVSPGVEVGQTVAQQTQAFNKLQQQLGVTPERPVLPPFRQQTLPRFRERPIQQLRLRPQTRAQPLFRTDLDLNKEFEKVQKAAQRGLGDGRRTPSLEAILLNVRKEAADLEEDLTGLELRPIINGGRKKKKKKKKDSDQDLQKLVSEAFG